MTHSQITSFIWSVAYLIRDSFRRGKYRGVILPLTVLRRIDQVLEPVKEKVLRTYSEFHGKIDNPDDLLRKASGYAFYNTSLYTFERLVDDPQNIIHNLRAHIQSFSSNMREVIIDNFDLDNTVMKLNDAGLLFQVMEKFAQVDLH